MNKQKDQNKKPKKALKIIFNVIFWCAIGWVAVWLVFNGIDKHTGYQFPFFGYRTSVIVSDSMGSVDPGNRSYITDEMEQIQKYDVITTKDYQSYEEIQKYDVITYFSGESLICHRVVDLYEDNGVQYIVTRGDANNINDDPIAYSLVRGKVVSVSKGTGKFLLFLQSGYVWIAIFGSVFFVCLGLFIFDSKKKGKKESAENNDDNEMAVVSLTNDLVENKEPSEEMIESSSVQEGPAQEAEQPVEQPKEPVIEEQPAEKEDQPIEEQTPEEPAQEIVEEQPKVEEAPAVEEKEPAKKAPKKPAPAKKAEPKPEPKEEKKPVTFRNYHVSKRADGKWQVKYAGGQKAIKLFDTQKEAMEYTKVMAENQGGSVLLHNSKGANKGKIKKK